MRHVHLWRLLAGLVLAPAFGVAALSLPGITLYVLVVTCSSSCSGPTRSWTASAGIGIGGLTWPGRA